MMGKIFSNCFQFRIMSTTTNDQLAGGTDLPASGAFIDVSKFERFHIIARLGVIHVSDAPTLEPKESDAIGGTLDQIDSSLIHTVDPADDQEYVTWTIETRKLSEDHKFIALDVGGTVSNGSFVDVVMFGEVETHPVVQDTAVLPVASKYNWTG